MNNLTVAQVKAAKADTRIKKKKDQGGGAAGGFKDTTSCCSSAYKEATAAVNDEDIDMDDSARGLSRVEFYVPTASPSTVTSAQELNDVSDSLARLLRSRLRQSLGRSFRLLTILGGTSATLGR